MTRFEQLTVRAPGKLMIAGEYAVLLGAPAVLTCVDRFAVAEILASDNAESRLVLRGGTALDTRFSMNGTVPAFAAGTDPQAISLVSALLGEFPPAAVLELHIDSRELYAGERKLGLGSSAAVTVAAGRALSLFSGNEPTLAALDAAHRRFQGGQGSGADVAAIAHGGTLVFEPATQCVRALSWPKGLQMQAVACSHAAATVARVLKFQQWQQSARQHLALAHKLVEAAQHLADAWQQGDGAAIIDEVRRFIVHMLAVDEAAALGYLAGEHRELLRLASDVGVVYKPCGAGGGDFGIALSMDDDAMRAFVSLARDNGFSLPELGMTDITPTVSRSARQVTR
ncbi:MAG: hypothetical protein AAF270_10975 [Pseudomonadota bacterium]